MTAYLSILTPMDFTFVGPFANASAAKSYAAEHVNPDHDWSVLTEGEYQANVAEFGPAPLQAP